MAIHQTHLPCTGRSGIAVFSLPKDSQGNYDLMHWYMYLAVFMHATYVYDSCSNKFDLLRKYTGKLPHK